jgi:hypothetical protein
MTRRPRLPARSELALATLIALALPGCPLSDQYYIDPALGHAGAAAEHAAAGQGPGMPGPKDMPMGGMPGTSPNDGGKSPDGSGGTPSSAGTPSNTTSTFDVTYPPDCSPQTYGSHVYLLCHETTPAAYVDYPTATARCESLQSDLGLSFGFELTFVESADEEAFLKAWIASVASTYEFIWLGANDIALEGTWVWGPAAGAAPFFHQGPMGGGMVVPGQYADFAPGDPNGTTWNDEDCGAFDGSVNWQWNDERCSERAAGFLCEETD